MAVCARSSLCRYFYLAGGGLLLIHRGDRVASRHVEPWREGDFRGTLHRHRELAAVSKDRSRHTALDSLCREDDSKICDWFVLEGPWAETRDEYKVRRYAFYSPGGLFDGPADLETIIVPIYRVDINGKPYPGTAPLPKDMRH